MANMMVARRNKLQTKGVFMDRGQFRASIHTDGKTIGLGRYNSLAEAAAAYRGAARILFGPYANRS